MPLQHVENKWYVFLVEVTSTNLSVSSMAEAIRLVMSNNDNTMIVIRNLIKKTANRDKFFETVHICL